MNKLNTFLDKFQPDLANDLVWEKVPPMSVLSSDMQPEKKLFYFDYGSSVLKSFICNYWLRVRVVRAI